MTDKSISSLERFDQIREQSPDLIVNLYALTPRGAVTLEIITPDGDVYTWTAETSEQAYALAFPPLAEPDPPEPETPPEPTGSIFD